jgi:hypothetical protein
MNIETVPIPPQSQHIVLRNHSGYTSDFETRILCWLARRITGNIVEIACKHGETTAEFAAYCPDRWVFGIDYTGPDTTLPEPQRCEQVRSENLGRVARPYPNVRLLDLKYDEIDYEALSLYGDEPIRFIYIDGDHSDAGVKTDSEKALPWIERHGGIVIWHDYYPTSPDWCGVYRFLRAEVAPRYPLKVIDKTWLAYVQL